MRPFVAASADGASGLAGIRLAFAVASVLTAMVLVVLDAAIANVTLPTIARELNVTPAMSVLVITAYQTALVISLLACSALGESLGHKRVFIAGVTVFVSASALCAMSPSFPWLIAGRFLQGLGGAAVMALGVALLRSTVRPDRLGAAIGWNALVVALSSAAGPTIGAAVLSVASWPWLFAVNLPIGAMVLFAAGALPDVAGTKRRLDKRSVALNAGGFASLIIGAEMLPAEKARAAVLLGVAATLFVVLIRREAPKEAPLIPLDLLRSGAFRIAVSASVLCFSGVAAAMVALPFYLQHGLGQSAWKTGLYMTPWPITVAMAAPLAGRLADRIATGWLCTAGGVILAFSLGALALLPIYGGLAALMALTMASGLGFGLFNVPNNRTMFLSAPRDRSGAAGGMQGTARLAGQTAGALIMTLLFSMTSLDAAPRWGLGIAALLTLGSGLVSALHLVAPEGVSSKGIKPSFEIPNP